MAVEATWKRVGKCYTSICAHFLLMVTQLLFLICYCSVSLDSVTGQYVHRQCISGQRVPRQCVPGGGSVSLGSVSLRSMSLSSVSLRSRSLNSRSLNIVSLASSMPVGRAVSTIGAMKP